MITKKGRVWWLDIWVGHGKGRKRTRRSLKTDERALALARAQKLERELKNGESFGSPTLGEALSQYKIWSEQAKPKSFKKESQFLDIMVGWLNKQGATRFSQITPGLIEQMRMSLMTERRLKKSSINLYLEYLKVFFHRAIDWGIFVGPSPADKVKYYKCRSEIWVPTEEEKDKIISAAKQISAQPYHLSKNDKNAADYVAFLFNTGMRPSEPLFLEKENIRDRSAYIYGKGGEWRAVPLNDAAWEIAERLLRETPGKWLFDVPNRFTAEPFLAVVEKIRKLSGVDRFTLHKCRKWFIVAMLRRGVDIKVIMDIVGHRRLSTTLLIYAYSYEGSRHEAVERLGHKVETPERFMASKADDVSN